MTAPSQSGRRKKTTPAIRRNGIQIRHPKPTCTPGSTPETVEQFLARGGQVDRLEWGASSRSYARIMREIGNGTKKQAQDKEHANR